MGNDHHQTYPSSLLLKEVEEWWKEWRNADVELCVCFERGEAAARLMMLGCARLLEIALLTRLRVGATIEEAKEINYLLKVWSQLYPLSHFASFSWMSLIFWGVKTWPELENKSSAVKWKGERHEVTPFRFLLDRFLLALCRNAFLSLSLSDGLKEHVQMSDEG